MRFLPFPARSTLPALLALALLGACRDAGETLVGPPPDAALALGLLPAGARGAVLHMNESSVAVGWALNEGNVRRAFRWARGGRLEDLGALTGAGASEANFINAAGQVAGTSLGADSKLHVFVWSAAGGMRDLGTLGGNELKIVGLSDAGHVAGWGRQADGSMTGFVVREGMPTQRMAAHYPRDVNAAGVVVGISDHHLSRPFQWTESGGVQPLPGPWGDKFWWAPQINDAGVIAGMAFAGGGVQRLVRWRPDVGWQELDHCTDPFGCMDDPVVVNRLGAVAWAMRNRVGVWEPGGAVREITTILSPTSLVLSDDGKVAGTGPPVGIDRATPRSFLWRRSVGFAYYRTATHVAAINGVGDLAGFATVSGKQRPARFAVPDNRPPVANAGGPYEVLAGEPLQVSAGRSTDPDGDALRVYWDAPYHRCCSDQPPYVPSSPAITYRWTVPGEYTIQLRVMDTDDLFSHAEVRVRVLPNHRGTSWPGPYTVMASQSVQFDGRRPDDPRGQRYIYRWSSDPSAPRAVFTRRFEWPGTFDAVLFVTDSAGTPVEVARTEVVVTPNGPTGFSAPATTPEGQPYQIRFTGYKVASNPYVQLSFSCGDGVFTPWRDTQNNSAHSCPGAVPGTRTVGGRIRDGYTGTGTEFTRTVVVTPRPPA